MRFQPLDLHKLHVVGAPTVSPEGQVVAVVQQTAGADRYGHRLWSFEEDLLAVPLIHDEGEWSEICPRFSPTGKYLAFISDRNGSPQPWLYVPNERTATQIVKLEGKVRELAWAGPELLVAVVDIPPPKYEAGHPVRISWLRYKADGRSGFVEGTTELWLIPINGVAEPLIQLQEGRIGAVAAAGRRVAYVVTPRHGDSVEETAQVRLLDLDDRSDELLWDCPAVVEAISIDNSADYVVVASAGLSGQGFQLQRRLWLIRPGSNPIQLFAGLDASFEYAVLGDSHATVIPTTVLIIPGTDRVLATATLGEDVALLEGLIGDPVPRRLTVQGCSTSDFSVSADGKVAVCLERPDQPTELYIGDTAQLSSIGISFRRVSDLNTAWIREARPVMPRTVSVRSQDGLELTGLFFCPPGPGPHPLFVRVHGGPHLCSGSSFSLEVQVEVAAGYAVLLPNLRGSAGRGEDFRSLTIGQWGGLDYEDLVAFVNFGESLPEIDPTRLYLAGGSYGGYLTNWALTRTSRFRAAISERSVSNLISKYGTSDNGFSKNRKEMGGADLFDDGIQLLLERSPLRYATSIRTPLLLLHGEDDKRCPIEQSEQLFVALRRLGQEVVMVRFAGESHNFPYSGRPDHRILRLSMILSWLAEHG